MSDFTAEGFCELHRQLFSDVYDWAGEYRSINMQKREAILAGKSVWYSNWDTIEKNLHDAFAEIGKVDWLKLTHDEFAKKVARLFPAIWKEFTRSTGSDQ